MATITASSKAVRYGIELDSYRAEAAAKVLDHVVQGDALNAHSRVESFGLIYANPPLMTSSGNLATDDSRSYSSRMLPAGSFLAAFSSTCCRPRNFLDVHRS